MIEEHVTLPTARLLKLAGYPQDTLYVRECVRHLVSPVKPTQAQAMRWLREEESISVEPGVTLDEQWSLNVWDFKAVDAIVTDDASRFPTYEAAAESGIQAACKYLIEKGAD